MLMNANGYPIYEGWRRDLPYTYSLYIFSKRQFFTTVVQISILNTKPNGFILVFQFNTLCLAHAVLSGLWPLICSQNKGNHSSPWQFCMLLCYRHVFYYLPSLVSDLQTLLNFSPSNLVWFSLEENRVWCWNGLITFSA